MKRDLILCAVVFLAVSYALCFLFFEGLGRRNRARNDEFADLALWDREMAEALRASAKRQHPAGGGR